jgi:DNA repair exonuclease SbcCD ATPase subunit
MFTFIEWALIGVGVVAIIGLLATLGAFGENSKLKQFFDDFVDEARERVEVIQDETAELRADVERLRDEAERKIESIKAAMPSFGDTDGAKADNVAIALAEEKAIRTNAQREIMDHVNTLHERVTAAEAAVAKAPSTETLNAAHAAASEAKEKAEKALAVVDAPPKV